MAIQYDEMGYAIGDDGIYPMDHVMAHAPSMPMQPSGSDVPYVVSAIPPPAASPPPSAPPRPQAPPPSQSYLERMSAPIQAAMTHMPGSAFVQGVAPLVNFPFQVAGSALYGLGKQIVSPETADFNKDTTEAMRATTYTPPSKAGSDYQEALMRAIEVSKLPPYLGHMPPARFSGSDARVLAKQNIERAREVGRITEDFRNAQSGITRESNLGGKTYGENLQAVASDIGDVAARQAARRNEYAPAMPGSVQVFSDLVPDTRKYMMQGPNSALWDKDSAARAAELEATGKTDKEIHYLTGTSRAGDNFQRQELSDVGSLVNPGFFELYKTHPQAIGKLTHQLPDVYEHPSIYTAYPQLRKVNVQVANLGKASAQYDDVNKILVIDSGIINNPQLVKEAIEHEMMHEIQVIEGFEKGGNSSMFPSKSVVETAQFLEKLMEQYNISAADAATMYKKQLLLPRKVDPQAIRYANERQGNLMPDTDPVARYQHIHGEIEAETPLGRSDLEQNQLQRFYPWAKDPKDVEGTLPQFTPDPYGRPRGRGAPAGVNPENALYRSTRNAKGELVFSDTPKYYRPPLSSTTPVSQMSAEIDTKPEIQQSVKEKGGNWPETWVDTNILRLQHKIPEFDPSKSFTQEQGNYIRYNYPDVATDYDIFYNETKQHHMRYGDDMWEWLASSEPKLYNDLVNKTTSNHVLNQWVEKRLRPYLKNDLATPTDPVRKLADEHGISHIKDLENTQSMSKFALEEARERNKMPLEGHATTQAGRMWENLADTSVHPMPGREFLGDYTATATRQPELYEAVRKDPTTKIHQLGSDFDTRLGLDHLMDELRSSLTGNVPPHLALTPKTLERMTMVDAVRHVSKVNEYREKQMAKTAAEDMKDFPPIRVYENGDKWHDLKLPALSEKAAQELKNDPLFGIPEQVRGSWDRNIARDLEARGFDDPESDDYMHAYITREQELAQDYYSRNPKTHKEAYAKLEKILKNEGDLMGHCVGSYCNDVSSGLTKILTLRDKNNKPHATIDFSVIYPRLDDLPSEVRAIGGTEQDQWIKDNPTVVLNQAKGKGNKPVIDKYQSQLLDLLNNPPNVHMIDSITDEGRHDLTSADIIDRDDTKSVMNALLSKLSSLDNRLDRYHDMLQQNPDLPRFISTDALAALMKTSLGNKRGGLIHMNDGGKVQPISPSPSVNDQSKPVTPIKTIINPDAPEFKEIFIRERANRVGGSGGGGGSGGADLKQIMNPRAHATGGGVNIDTMRYALLRKKHG